MPPRLELLEDRLAPAASLNTSSFTVVNSNAAAADIRTVIFFESSVANWQILSQGLSAGTQAVVLNAGGNGLSEMAAFLNGQHGLSAIDIVAHGSAGQVDLGTATLTAANLGSYSGQLTAIGGALAGGEIDLWSCDTAAGSGGAALVQELSAATGTAVAAADHLVAPRRWAAVGSSMSAPPARKLRFHSVLPTARLFVRFWGAGPVPPR